MSAVRVRAERAVFSLPRIKRETFVRGAELHRSIDSTNTRAMELAADSESTLPLLVLTENQTAGRGRGSNVWWSAPGALTFSLVLDLANHDTRPESWPRFALAAAAGICEALESFAPNTSFGIRWPNDVCAGPRKICGILPELRAGKSSRLVLGIGINANNSMDAAPAELQSTATSLLDLTGRRTDLTDLLIEVLRRLEARLGDLANASSELSAAWSDRCLLRGRNVELRVDNVSVRGHCEGIDPHGALLLRTGSKTARFYGGSIASVTD